MFAWVNRPQLFTNDPLGQSVSCIKTGSQSVPKQKFGKGPKLPKMAMHCRAWDEYRLFALRKFRRCQSYFSEVEFQILDFPWCVLDFRGPAAAVRHLGILGSVRVPQFSSSFDFHRKYRNCRNGKVWIARGSKIDLVPDFSRDPFVAKDGFGLGASSRFWSS